MSLDTRRTRNGALCCVDGAIGARTTRSAALGRHDDSLAARRSLGGRRRRLRQSRAGDATRSKRRGDVTRHTAHAKRRALCVDGTIGARTTRSAALGRHDDSLAARRSLGVAGGGSDRAEPAMRREGKRRGDVTRHTAHAKRRALCVDGTIGARTTRSAALGRHDDSLAARRSLGVAGGGSDRAEPAMRRGEQEAR